MRFLLIFSFLLCLKLSVEAQSDVYVDYTIPTEYEIAGIRISGVKYLQDLDIVATLSGLKVGDKIAIPSDRISDVIKKYWKQGLFSDVKLFIDSIAGDKIYLNIELKERPRISEFRIVGVKEAEEKELKEKLEIKKGMQLTDNLENGINYSIRNYYVDKGYYNVKISIEKQNSAVEENNTIVIARIDKGVKIKIREIIFIGNKAFDEYRLQRTLKETRERKWRYFFKSSRYLPEKYEEDKEKLLAHYNKNGFRDAQIVKDSIAMVSEDRMDIYITLREGQKFYFRDITWSGNTKYSSEALSVNLGIKRGEVYDQDLLDKRLYIDEDAVSSLYLDNGYLFSSIDPVEILVSGDSIDLEMRITEGNKASLSEVIIQGNTKTNEHVIRRELRTKPGDLFSKKDIIRSVRELAQLGHFDPEQIAPNPIPHPEDGTVDVKYDLVEKPNDQLELSGGWGAGMIVGTLGVKFNNFSAKNFFKASAWRPVPSGDGQQLSLRAQTNGKIYQAYSLNFVEPWFGGKKPNSFSISMYHTIRTGGSFYTKTGSDKSFKVSGLSFGLGRRLKWPDDYFTMFNEIGIQNYTLKDYGAMGFVFADGSSNNLSFTTTIGRNSLDQPIYPRTGSNFSVSLQITPPYSAFSDLNYDTMADAQKYKWIEYHKWKFNSQWVTSLVGNLVLFTRADFGYLAYYSKKIGPSPFESFDVGGDGLSNYNLYGRDIIAQRGYANGSLTPVIGVNNKSGNIYNKVTLELRYPFVLKTSATVYGLAFFEGGNCWYDSKTFNPFDMKRALGVGIRAFLPMFGLLGVDWGYGFDEVPGGSSANKSQFAFTIGQQF